MKALLFLLVFSLSFVALLAIPGFANSYWGFGYPLIPSLLIGFFSGMFLWYTAEFLFAATAFVTRILRGKKEREHVHRERMTKAQL